MAPLQGQRVTELCFRRIFCLQLRCAMACKAAHFFARLRIPSPTGEKQMLMWRFLRMRPTLETRRMEQYAVYKSANCTLRTGFKFASAFYCSRCIWIASAAAADDGPGFIRCLSHSSFRPSSIAQDASRLRELVRLMKKFQRLSGVSEMPADLQPPRTLLRIPTHQK